MESRRRRGSIWVDSGSGVIVANVDGARAKSLDRFTLVLGPLKHLSAFVMATRWGRNFRIRRAGACVLTSLPWTCVCQHRQVWYDCLWSPSRASNSVANAEGSVRTRQAEAESHRTNWPTKGTTSTRRKNKRVRLATTIREIVRRAISGAEGKELQLTPYVWRSLT